MEQETQIQPYITKANPSNRFINSFITLFMVALVLLVVIIIGSYLINKRSSDATNNQAPESISETVDSNNVNLDGLTQNKPIYAAINLDDTVSYFLENDTEIFAAIEKREWKHLKYSPDIQNISALAKSDSGFYDIYIYNLQNKKLERATNFNSESNGVNAYFWHSETEIYLQQGKSVDNWLYSYNLISRQLIKLERIQGEFIGTNSEKDIIIFNHNNEFNFYNLKGEKLWSFTNLKTETGEEVDDIKNIIFTELDEKLLAVTESGKIYKFNFENTLGIEVPTELTFNIVCSPTKDLAIGYEYSKEFETLLITSLNTKTNREEVIAQLKIAESAIQDDSFVCEEPNTVYFRTSGEKRTTSTDGLDLEIEKFNDWYKATEDGFEIITILKNAKYINSSK